MSYEDPFGDIRAQSGDVADDNPFRFSTKQTDNGTGLLYYGHRYYSPASGRWLSRDPIKEPGFSNLRMRRASRPRPDTSNELGSQYVFVRNDPVTGHDRLGLMSYVGTTCPVFCNYRQIGKIKIDAYSAVLAPGGLMTMGVVFSFVETSTENRERCCCDKLRWIQREALDNIRWNADYTDQIVGDGSQTFIAPPPGYPGDPGVEGDEEPYYDSVEPVGIGPGLFEDWPRSSVSDIPEGWTGSIGFRGSTCVACQRKTGRDSICGFCVHWHFVYHIDGGEVSRVSDIAPSCGSPNYDFPADLAVYFPAYEYQFE